MKINIEKRVLDWQCDSVIGDNELFIEKNNLHDLQPFIAINPFTSVRKNNFREWDYDNFATISEYCKNQYSLNTVILGKTNSARTNKLIDCFNSNTSAINLINKTSLSEMLSVLSLSELYIGPDSGTFIWLEWLIYRL